MAPSLPQALVAGRSARGIGTILAHSTRMRLGYLALSAVIGVAGVVFSERPDRIATRTATDAPAARQDRVQIEHEIVRIPVMPVTNPNAPRFRKATSEPGVSALPRQTTRLARSEPRSDDKDKKGPLLNRAVQRIVGNGRYTPQPFPRPAR